MSGLLLSGGCRGGYLLNFHSHKQIKPSHTKDEILY